jgi:GNAT superfamily N-acetyltransferase
LTLGVEARAAMIGDASEVVRLAAVMYGSMGIDANVPAWVETATEMFRSRLGRDLAAFVVDHPDGEGLAASCAGTIAHRLPGPNRPTARTGYVQWVATDPNVRSKGFGRAVMVALLDWFDREGVVVVELHATPAGEPLYPDLGFSDDGPVALRRIAAHPPA